MVRDYDNQAGSDNNELQKKTLEKEMASLQLDYALCAEEALTNLDPVSKSKLEVKKKQLRNRIDEIDRQLRNIERQSKNANRQILNFDEALPRIDFEKARESICQVLKKLDSGDGGAALMLLQQSEEMAGDLLMMALKDILSRDTISPLWYSVAFPPSVGGADADTFLKLLSGHFGVELAEDQRINVQAICKTICNSLRTNSTIVIHLTDWDAVAAENQHELMQWLLEEFWKPLVNQLSNVLDKWYVRIIFVIVANTELTDECQKIGCFCTVDSFDSFSVLELPLEYWEERDINVWLRDHFQISKQQREIWARYIYTQHKGDPCRTRQALQRYFDQLIALQTNDSME